MANRSIGGNSPPRRANSPPRRAAEQARQQAQEGISAVRDNVKRVWEGTDTDKFIARAKGNKRLLGPALVAAVALGWHLFSTNVVSHKYPIPPKGLVLVTGTGSGIGHNITNLLADNGFTVVAGVHRAESSNEWKGRDNVHAIKLDVTKQSDIDGVYDRIVKFMQKADLPFSGLVNNAGVMDRNPIELHDPEAVRALFDTNTLGPLTLTQRFLPLIRENKARIVFTSSVAGRLTQPKEGIYSATKHAVEAIANALRQELLQFGVSVSLIEPGFVKTPIMDRIKYCESHANATQGGKIYPHLYVPSQTEVYAKGIKNAGDPQQPAKAVLHALTSAYPKTRYEVTNLVRIPTWLVLRIKWLVPDRVFDRIVIP